MKNKTLCIIGGTGFVGTALVNRLVREKYQLKIFTRRPERVKHLKSLPGIKLISLDYYAPKLLERQFDGTDAIINLSGILNPQGGEDFNKVHVELPRRIAQAAAAVGVKRLLHMSALNAGNKASKYLISKGQGQQVVHEAAGINVTTFCPSIIYGPGDSFFNRFAAMMKIPGPMPLVGARAKFAPIYVEDVVDAFINALENPKTYARNFSLCGPKEYSFLELINYTAQVMNINKTIIALNWPLSTLMTRMLSILPMAPISMDNLNSLKVDSCCQGPVSAELKIDPKALETILPWYLGNKEINSFRDQLRQTANR